MNTLARRPAVLAITGYMPFCSPATTCLRSPPLWLNRYGGRLRCLFLMANVKQTAVSMVSTLADEMAARKNAKVAALQRVSV